MFFLLNFNQEQKTGRSLPFTALSGVEAAPGLEPGMMVLQTIALPLGYAALLYICSEYLQRMCHFWVL